MGLPALGARAATATLERLGLDKDSWDIAVLGCDDGRIAELNGSFRAMDAPTNVLSWPSAERGPASPGSEPEPPAPGNPELGDLAIAYETCLREAEAAGIPFDDHVTHLVVHGILHLLGYDHETEPDAQRMESLEVEILATLGVPNPY